MQLKKYEFVDFLRGIAIFLVFLNHIPRFDHTLFDDLSYLQKKFFLAGTYGVQLFYIVSAFTLLISLYRRSEKNYFNFYLRRIFRIVPIFYLGIIVHTHIFNLEPTNLKNILLNLLFLNNLIPPSNDLILGGTTIATEMNFYLILPLMFLYINSYKKSLIFLIFSIFLLFILNKFFGHFYPDHTFGNANFYRTIFVQIFVFLLGFITFFINYKFLVLKESENKGLIKDKLLKILPLIIIAALIFLLGKQYTEYFYFRNMFFVSIILFLFVNFIILFEKLISNNLIFLIFKKLGTVSFSIYVWHWVVVTMVWNYYFSKISNFTGKILIYITVSLILTYIVSLASYQIEKYFIKIGKKLTDKN